MSTIPSVAQLHRAIKIAEQIQSLESELAAILGNASAPVTKSVAPTASAPAKRKYTRKAAAVVSDASAATDAAVLSVLGKGKTKRKYTKKAATSTESPAPAKKRKKGKMSAEGLAAVVAAQKARWAKVKKEKAKK